MGVFYSAEKVEQINVYLFIDTIKANKIKIGVNEMTVNDSEMCVRRNNEAWSIPETSLDIFSKSVNHRIT